LVGVIYGLLAGRRRQWRGDDRLRRHLTIATVAWAVVCGLRFSVQGVLYLNDQPSLLAAAKLTLDWPLTIGAVLLTLALIRRGTSGRTPHESQGHPQKEDLGVGGPDEPLDHPRSMGSAGPLPLSSHVGSRRPLG
jgi:Protein of unknown function (DUF3159)